MAALKPLVEELSQLDTPLETETLQARWRAGVVFLAAGHSPQPLFCQRLALARERIVRDFGAGVVFFNDLTTDPKLNPNPKPQEIVLAFKSDFESLLQQNPAVVPDKRNDLMALYRKDARCKETTAEARLEDRFRQALVRDRVAAFLRASKHRSAGYHFAQRLPALIEQLVIVAPQQETLDPGIDQPGGNVDGSVINPDHLMIINNVGKGSALGKTWCINAERS